MGESFLKKFHRKHRCGDNHACYDGALKEMQGGRKHTHWIWWVFPQVSGLGSSYRAKKYAIQSLQEAVDFLEDPVLGAHYCEITEVVMKQICREGVSLPHLFRKEIDVRKFISSITLFQWVASRQQSLPVEEVEAPMAGNDYEESEGMNSLNYGKLLDFCKEVIMEADRQGFPPCHKTLEWIAQQQQGSALTRPVGDLKDE
jgi:uncharacterized protein (DUF1810 family)